VIHRDLKTENVLLVSLSEKSPIRGKISDFGTRYFFKKHNNNNNIEINPLN